MFSPISSMVAACLGYYFRRSSSTSNREQPRATGCLDALVLMMALATGCNHHENVPCVDNSDCNLSGGGTCLMTPATEHQWCAYPDPDCTSGYRYSNDDVGDGVGGACTAGTSDTLTVSVGGNGAGNIVSTPSGLTCASGTCTGKFQAGSQVQLTAAPTSGSFLGWSNDCHGTDTCVVTMNGDRGVGALFGIPGQALWLRAVSGAGGSLAPDGVRNIGMGGGSLAMDGDGNLIIVGSFRGTIQLGATTLTSAGKGDLFVAKMSSSTGDVVWAKRFGGTGYDFGSDVAVDASNAIYIAGSYQSPSIDFGGGALSTTGFRGGFLVKLAADGSHVWSRNLGSSNASSDSAWALGVAVNGNGVAVAGTYAGSMTIDGTTLTSAGNGDIFAAKFTTDGSLAWVKSFGEFGYDSGYDVAIDKHGNVIIVGSFQGTIPFPDDPVAAGSNEAGLLVKLASADGSPLVSRRFGSTNTNDRSVAFSVAVDAADNIFVAGGFTGSGDFGGSVPLTATRKQDAFLAKYTSVGSYIWARSFGGTGDDESAVSVSVNATGDVAITGSFCGAISLGGNTLTAASQCPSTGGTNQGTDMFAARFSGANGSHLASARGGGARNDVGNSVVLAPDGRIFVSGSFEGFAEFGGATVTALGPSTIFDGFVVGLPPL